MTPTTRTVPQPTRSPGPPLTRWGAGLLALALFVLVPSLSAEALEIGVHPESTRIGAGEDLRLRVTVEGEVVLQIGSPDTEDFRVVQHSSASRSQNVRGQIQRTTEVHMRLRPLRTGRLMVGPIPIRTPSGIHHTEPFPVVVEQGDAASAQRGQQQLPALPRPPLPDTRRAAAEQEKDRDPALPPTLPAPESDEMIQGPQPLVERGQPFVMTRSTREEVVVGEPFVVDFVLFAPTTQIGLEVVDLDDPAFEGFWFHEVTRERLEGRNTRLGSMRIRGELFEAHLIRSYSAVVLRPDVAMVPGIGLTIRTRGFLRDQGEERLRSPAMPLSVSLPPTLDRPTAATDANVGRFAVSLSHSSDRLRPGEPALVSFRVQGTGLTSRIRLPDAPAVPGLHFGEPRDRVTLDSGLWPRGEAVREWPVRATEEGSHTIPSIRFGFWDPWSRGWQEVGSDPVLLEVLGPPVADVMDQDEAERPWHDDLPPLPDIEALRAERSRPLHHSPWYPFAVALPLLLLVLLRAIPPFLKRVERARSARRADSVALALLAGLDPEGSPEHALREVERLLHDACSRRLARPTRGLTLEALDRLVADSQDSDLRDAVELLAAVERTRFAGAAAASASQLVSRARACIPPLLADGGR